jgi:nucleoside-diphosphate-sugar epimerase
MTRSILVTGANGFVGAALMRRLSEAGHTVCGTVRENRDRLPADPPRNIEIASCDLADRVAVRRLFNKRRFDTVIHTAARLGPQNDPDFGSLAARNNVCAQANLLDQAVQSACQRYIFCSSISVYEGEPAKIGGFLENDAVRPTTLYGWSKYAAEEFLASVCHGKNEIHGVSLRLSGIHGPGKVGGAVYHMVRAARAGEDLNVNEPESRFRLLFQNDAVEALVSSITAPLPGPYSCYNIASRDAFTLRQLAETIISKVGSNSHINEPEAGDAPRRNQVMDTSLAKLDLGFSGRSLDESLSNYLACT